MRTEENKHMQAEPTPPGPDAEVSLREISEDTLRPILELNVGEDQQHFVASNAVSIAEAHFSDYAWFRAIYAGETPVGFLMLYDNPEKPTYYLWRFMIGARYQKHGYGYRAMKLLIEHVKTRPNATELLLSHVPGEGCPEGFYRKLGFEHTGKEEDGELEMRLLLKEFASV